MSRTATLLQSHGLSRHFTLARGQIVRAVHGVSLAINEQEIVGLVGESGSGKSTYGKTLIGLLEKTEGTVTYRGEQLPRRYRPADFRHYARKMQMIYQEPYASLDPHMTVRQIIGEGLRLHTRQSSALIDEKVAHWLRRVGLEPDHMFRHPHEFSGGQCQRIGIARALILEPEVVVCDEPISALDLSVQAQILNLLDELKRSMGLTLLLIAHDLSMVRYVSDRMAVMYLGTLVETGPANDVFFDPRHPYTELLIHSIPKADPRKARDRRHRTLADDFPTAAKATVGCSFANRCPKAMDVCRKKAPVLIPQADRREHAVACHLYR